MNVEKFLPTNWHTYAFDFVFLILNFTFFPLIGNRIIGWFDLWLAGKGEGFLRAIFLLALLGFIAYIGLIIALYLKRFSIQSNQKDFKSGGNLAFMNVIAVFSTLWFVFVGIIEFLRLTFGDENIYPIIAVGIIVFLFGLVLVYLAYKLLLRLDEPLSETEELQKKKHNWRYLPTTQFFANLSLFKYIFLLQCFYYAYTAEMIGENVGNFRNNSDDVLFFSIGIFVTFIILYAAPRLIYLKGLDEKGNTLVTLLPVFIASIIGHFLPDFYSWMF